VTGAFTKSAWPNARQLQAAALVGSVLGIRLRARFGF
jgi:hypothetical protein